MEGFKQERFLCALLAGLVIPLLMVAGFQAESAQKTDLGSKKVRISYSSPGFAFVPAKAAIERGFFKEENLEVDFFQMSPRLVLAALDKGEIDYTLTFSTVVDGALKGFPFRMVGAITTKPMHYLVARPELVSVNDLKGKVLGVSAVGDTDNIAAEAILEALGGDPKSLKVLALGNEGVRAEAMRRGKIDVVAVSAPWPVLLKNEGFNVLGGPKNFKAGSPISAVSTTEKKIKEDPEEVKKVLRAILRGLKFVHSNREETVRIASSWLGLSQADASVSYELALPSLSTDGKAPEESYLIAIRQRKKALNVEKEIPVSQLLDWRLLEEILQKAR